MNPRLFYAQCQAHNWNWRKSADREQQAEGCANENRLAAIATESSALTRIFHAIQQDRTATQARRNSDG